MLLIREDIDEVKTSEETLLEEGKEKKSLYIEGLFMQSEVKNRNGRIYPKAVLESAVNNFLKLIEDKRSIGELNHPPTPSVNPERASHIITSLKFEGNDIHGKARILESMPCGVIVKNLLSEGVKLGVSSRAMGTLKNVGGINYVQPDLMLSTVDVVIDPSGPDCFVNGIMENKEWIYESGIWKAKDLDDAKTIITSASSKELVEKQLKVFEYLLNNVK